MGTRYTVKSGDSLSKIARSKGLPSWRIIYNHPDNADFRRKRPNPNLIHPGDTLVIPNGPKSPPSAVVRLPWNFASRHELPPLLTLEPLKITDLSSIAPRLFPPANPAFNFSSPGLAPPKLTLGGPVVDIPTGPGGAPITGGYGDAVKWTGKAILKYPFVSQRLDSLKDWAVDIAWTSAPPWRKGLEVGLGLGGAAVLLSIRPTREFIFEKAHGQDIPLSLVGINWLSVQPRLGINGDWGGVITFDLQNFINPAEPKKKP